MKCSLCGKVALYFADHKGFCGDHRAKAVVATRKWENDKKAFMIRNDLQGHGVGVGYRPQGSSVNVGQSRKTSDSRDDTLPEQLEKLQIADFRPKVRP